MVPDMRPVVITMFFVLLATCAQAPQPTRVWKVVPGHNNMLVDIASVRPNPMPIIDGIPPMFDTEVAIRLNGHLFEHFWITCDPDMIGSQSGDEPVSIDGRDIGTVPPNVIEAIACPLRPSAPYHGPRVNRHRRTF